MRSLVIALALSSIACVPVVTPPARGEFGVSTQVGGESHMRFGGGAHVASAVPDFTFPLEIGAGYVGSQPISTRAKPLSHGIYLEGGPKIAGGRTWRAFAGGRAEVYFAPNGPDFAYAGMARLNVEAGIPIKAEPVESTGGRGFYVGVALGTVAIGAYLEAGYQRFVSDAGLAAVGTGLTLRLPATFGLACCAWDLK